jgi:hypothetical protein
VIFPAPLRSLGFALCLLVPASALWALDALETPAGEASLAPRLAEVDGGRAVLSWLDITEDGHRLMFSDFDGETFGPAQPIASGERFFANWADTPGIRVGRNDRWLAHWLVRSGRGTYAYDVVMALSEDAGRTWSEPFSPHDDGTLTEHGFVSTFLDPRVEAGFGAVWLDGRETEPAAEDRHHDHSNHPGDHHHGSGSMTLRSASIQADGRVVQPAVLDARVCDCCPTDTAITGDSVIVVYRDRSEEEIRDIALVRREGPAWSDPIIVHADGWRITGCPVNGPAVLAQGETVFVAWFTMAEERARVQLARSGDGGRSFSPPMELDAGTALGRVDLTWSGDSAVLSWLDEVSAGAMLRVARFDRSGRLVERRDLRTVDEGRISGLPQLLGLDDGRVLLAWTGSSGQPGRPRVQVGWFRFEPETM